MDDLRSFTREERETVKVKIRFGDDTKGEWVSLRQLIQKYLKATSMK